MRRQVPKRILTKAEKADLVGERHAYEVHQNPDLIITVTVNDETDERGNPSFVITRQKEHSFHA